MTPGQNDLSPRPIDVIAAHLGPGNVTHAGTVLAILESCRRLDPDAIRDARLRIEDEIARDPSSFTGHEYGSANHWSDVWRHLGDLVNDMHRD